MSARAHWRRALSLWGPLLPLALAAGMLTGTAAAFVTARRALLFVALAVVMLL